jgi:dipeptidyl aminopeptidase/acylaminoacyl peptidase
MDNSPAGGDQDFRAASLSLISAPIDRRWSTPRADPWLRRPVEMEPSNYGMSMSAKCNRGSTPAISPNGKWAVQIDANDDGLLRNLSSDRETKLDFNLQQVDRAAFSPDGSLLAVVNWLGVGQVWDTEEAREVATLRGFLQGQHSVAFSPDGDRLAIGSNAREAVKLWDVVSWQELLTLEGEGSLFYAVEFSPVADFLGQQRPGPAAYLGGTNIGRYPTTRSARTLISPGTSEKPGFRRVTSQ